MRLCPCKVYRFSAFPFKAGKHITFMQFVRLPGWTAGEKPCNYYFTIIIILQFQSKRKPLWRKLRLHILPFCLRHIKSMGIKTGAKGTQVLRSHILFKPSGVFQYAVNRAKQYSLYLLPHFRFLFNNTIRVVKPSKYFVFNSFVPSFYKSSLICRIANTVFANAVVKGNRFGTIKNYWFR